MAKPEAIKKVFPDLAIGLEAVNTSSIKDYFTLHSAAFIIATAFINILMSVLDDNEEGALSLGRGALSSATH